MEKHLAIANYVCVVGLYSSAHLIVSRGLGKHLFVHSHHSGELQCARQTGVAPIDYTSANGKLDDV